MEIAAFVVHKDGYENFHPYFDVTSWVFEANAIAGSHQHHGTAWLPSLP